MVRSGFVVNNTKERIHPAVYQWFRLVVVCWCQGYFLGTFWGPLVPIDHRLNAKA